MNNNYKTFSAKLTLMGTLLSVVTFESNKYTHFANMFRNVLFYKNWKTITTL